MLRSSLKVAVTLAPILSVLLVVGCGAVWTNTPPGTASPQPETGSDAASAPVEMPSAASSTGTADAASGDDAGAVPTFADYAVNTVFAGTPAEVNLDSHPDAYTFRGQLWDGVA